MATVAFNLSKLYIIENLHPTRQLDHANTDRNLLLKNKKKERKEKERKKRKTENKETNFTEALTV